MQARIFLGISTFMALIGIVYWFASYEPAGTTMLGLSSALAAVCGVYLQIQHEHDGMTTDAWQGTVDFVDTSVETGALTV